MTRTRITFLSVYTCGAFRLIVHNCIFGCKTRGIYVLLWNTKRTHGQANVKRHVKHATLVFRFLSLLQVRRQAGKEWLVYRQRFQGLKYVRYFNTYSNFCGVILGFCYIFLRPLWSWVFL